MSVSTNKEVKAGGTSLGIALFCYGRKGYAAAANNLALTFKEHSPSIPLHIWVSDGMTVDPSLFYKVHKLDHKQYAQGPGTLKVGIYDILPKGDWLYMDVDSLLIADITPFIERLKEHDFLMEVKGRGKESDVIEYTPWATNATVKRVCELPETATYFGVQSSWMWIRKPSKTAKDIFTIARNVTYTAKDLKEPWGHDIPDELRFASALSVLGIHLPTFVMSFYGNESTRKGLSDVASSTPIVCLYGDGRQHRLIRSGWMEVYDRYIRNIYAKERRTMHYSLHNIMQDKYVNRP